MPRRDGPRCNVCGDHCPTGHGLRCTDCVGLERCVACEDFFMIPRNGLCEDCQRLSVKPPHDRKVPPEWKIEELARRAALEAPLFEGD